MRIHKTKWGDYEQQIKFPVFADYTIHVIFTDSIARSRKGRYGTEGAAEGAAAMSSVAVGGHGHLFFKRENSAGIIAHEAWHAIYRMFEYLGSELDNEMVAYHLTYLVDKILSFLAHIEFWESNQSSRKQATNERQNSQGVVAGVQDVSAHSRGATVAAGEAGSGASPQADGCGYIGLGC
jgi:hypothetical protein